MPPGTLIGLVARNLAPAIGVLAFGWSASNLLVLYYVDTVLAIAVLVLLIARHVTGLGPVGRRGRPMRGVADWTRASAGALLAALLIGLPLAVPLVMLLAQFDWPPAAALADPRFVQGLVLQGVGSVVGAVQVHRALLARDDDEAVLKRRALFVFARWLAVLVVALAVPAGLLGPRFGGACVVLAYAIASVAFEQRPEWAARWLGVGRGRR